MQWPTSAGGTLERSTACFEATAPSSIAERSFSVPPKVPKPVRTPERNTTSVFEPWVFIGGKLHVRRGEYRRDGVRAVGRGDLTCSRLPRAKRALSGRVQTDLHVFPILHIALEVARLLHTKYAGTPVATIPRPIKACTGRATIVFPTIAAAAAMNSAGVTG